MPTPIVDAELLIAHVLRLSRGEVHVKMVTGTQIDSDDVLAVTAAVERRATREPLQHITGIAPFRSLELAVGPGVFVPRPETEQVAQIAIDFLRANANGSPLAVDLGAGSGAIAIALASEVPHARVVAVENSPAAFIWAKSNVRTAALDNLELQFVDLANALPHRDGTVDLVISNPPYIPTGAIPRDPEVRLFDPAHALYGGEDGLDVVRQVSATAKRLLRPGGNLVIEHGDEQAPSISEFLRADGWHAVGSHRDLSGRDRATTAIR